MPPNTILTLKSWDNSSGEHCTICSLRNGHWEKPIVGIVSQHSGHVPSLWILTSALGGSKVLGAITKVRQSSSRHPLLYMKAMVYACSKKELMLHYSEPLVTSSCHGLSPPPATMLSAVRRWKVWNMKSAGGLAMATATALNQWIV